MELIYALQDVASPALDRVMLLVTNLGSEQGYVLLLILGFVVVDARLGRSLAVVFLSGMYLNAVLKLAFSTQRPFEIDPTVARSAAAIETAPGSGFPSGHAQGAMTFWGTAATFVRRSWFTLLAAVVVALVSVSRLYLGVHLPIDVIGGLAIGMLVVVVGVAVQRSGARLSRPLVLVGGVLVPFVLQLALPTDNSGVFLGGLAAFIVGPELIRHETRGPLLGRIVLGVIAVALVFGVLMASSALLSEEVKRSVVGSFVRYLVLGLCGTALVPYLGRVSGLTPARPAAEQRVPGGPQVAAGGVPGRS
jgi:membrane-associated phospholipid phosphatase